MLKIIMMVRGGAVAHGIGIVSASRNSNYKVKSKQQYLLVDYTCMYSSKKNIMYCISVIV